MSNREQNRRENDSLQSGEGNLASGQEQSDFGAGGQTAQQAIDGDDAPDRDVRRDGSLPGNADPSARKQHGD